MKAAIYARYSTDKQSESSIDDQLRECRKLAARHDFDVTAEYADKAISGGTVNRPGYQDMLNAARESRFDVICAEDTSRLWRNLSEQAQRLAELQDLGVHVVTHDLDTRQESAGILGAVNGAMSEQYRREIARRTRRGLEGLARQKKSTGGRAYGYIAATDSESGEREIDPEQAEIVRRIFEEYAAGMSPRAIAAALNAERIPSPGSQWNRTSRRHGGWAQSAIAGDAKRGIGVLNNEIYVGRVIWNRFKWVRSASDSSRRKCIQNPRDEWIVHEDERLRIVPQELWDRVKARQKGRSELIGERVRQGLSKTSAKSTGRSPRYLFSSLLKCGACGSSYSIRGRSHYACARHLDGRACTQTTGVKRAVVEPGILHGIRQELLSEEAIAAAVKAAHKVLNEQRKPKDNSKRIAKLQAEVENLTDAIASGTLKASAAIGTRLAKAENELAELEAVPAGMKPAKLVPGIRAEYERWIRELETVLSPEGMRQGKVTDRDIARTRAQLKKRLGGHIVVTETDSEIRFQTEASAEEMALSLAGNGSQVFMVAGAGFEPATFGL